MDKSTYQLMLDRHDWYYMMSDDFWVYRRGQEKQEKIEEIAKSSAEFARMYDDHWFKYFGAPRYNKQNTRDTAPMLKLGLYTL